jgi:hypothetical protein
MVGTLIYQIDLQRRGLDNRNELGCLHVRVVSFHILSPYYVDLPWLQD